MDKIYDTNSNFNFDHLLLSKPILQNGGYFIKYSIYDYPLYIRPPKSIIKQILKNTKKINCDLIFSQENEEFIQWMENLEYYSQQSIFKNKGSWFESNLEMEDIENSFTSPIKSYKSGKFYVVRTNITQRLGKINIKIFNEDENDVPLEDISGNMNVMTILEVQGIKCSSKSFQIDIELKQMMVLNPVDIFEKCILNVKKNESVPNKTIHLGKIPLEESKSTILENHPLLEEYKEQEHKEQEHKEQEHKEENKQQYIQNQSIVQTEYTEEPENKDLEKNATEENEEKNENELYEININLEEMPEVDTITLKERNDVYYELYRNARRKAKIAKDLALSAYLEAKQIKNKYMLDDLSDSDEDESFFNEENK
jgi:hypothetical protein